MQKLKFPRVRVHDDGEPLRVAAPSVAVLLGRREFLKALGIAVGALAIPMTGFRRAWATARGRFFTAPERATLEALCDRIIPPDDGTPGGRALGAATYIEGLLTAFDRAGRTPPIYAGGPFSGRTPFPDNRDGTPSRRRPRDAFRHFIPLTRVQEIRWRAELFGSDMVRGADFNDALLGPLPGLRPIYRDGLAHVDAVAQMIAGQRYAALGTPDQDRVFGLLDTGSAGVRFAMIPRRDVTFLDILIVHTLEGCLAAPEYGGNLDLGGWQLVGLEGDDQPLGYSIFSRRDGVYHERPDHPMSTPNPDELDPTGALQPRPLSSDGDRIQRSIAQFSNLLANAC